MFTRLWSVATLLIAALNTGLAFAHVLELPAKLRLNGPNYTTVQSIYRAWGPAGAVLEPSGLISAFGLAWLLRQRPGGRLALAGAGLLGVSLAGWFAFVAPMNAKMLRWPTQGVPRDWTRVRNQWEFSHATRFLLELLALTALTASALAGPAEQTPATTLRRLTKPLARFRAA